MMNASQTVYPDFQLRTTVFSNVDDLEASSLAYLD